MYEQGWDLPAEWSFGDFTWGEFEGVYTSLRAVTLAWVAARSFCFRSGFHMFGFALASGVVRIRRDVLIQLVHAACHIPITTVRHILEMLTFGSHGIRTPNIMLQPIVELPGRLCLVAPFVLFNAADENNLCSLLNRIGRYKRRYSALTNQKESLMREELERALQGAGWDLVSGEVEETDVDVAIVDRENKTCLCVELKWFIQPGPIREVVDRGEDLAKGVAQSMAISRLHSQCAATLHSLFKIDETFDLLPIVGSMNWIGNEVDQSTAVPVVNFRHLIRQLLRDRCLPKTIEWLRERAYLPVLDRDFTRTLVDVRCGPWRAQVGALRLVE
jgi:hypothetical protein